MMDLMALRLIVITLTRVRTANVWMLQHSKLRVNDINNVLNYLDWHSMMDLVALIMLSSTINLV